MLDELFDSMLEDPEVMRFVNYMASDEFEAVIGLLRYNSAFIDLLEFVCDELHLDVYFYLNLLGEILSKLFILESITMNNSFFWQTSSLSQGHQEYMTNHSNSKEVAG